MGPQQEIQPLIDVITTVTPILGMLGIIVGAFQFWFSRINGYGSGGGVTIAGGVMIIISGYLMKAIVGSAPGSGSGGAAEKKAPAHDTPSFHVDWALVGSIAAGVVGLVVLVILIFVVSSKMMKARDRDAAEAQRLDRIWKEAVERHDRIRETWLDFQQDIEKLLTFPVMTDVSEPKTAAFIDAMGKATDLATDKRPKSAEAVERYAHATRTAETKWQAALHNAERVRLARFEPGERERIKKVQLLLRQAKSGAATPQERRTYYERARDLLGDLIPLPEPARLALEQTVRGELSITKPASTWTTYSTPTTPAPEPVKGAHRRGGAKR
ncbi:MAG TPA: hypothetical protein VF426_13130 [Marmoricola sp.]